MATYVLSDPHGAKDRFDQMLEKIAFSKGDFLYIIGDVIDRGKDGIPLLLEIMKQDNIFLLRGNHEQMMLDALEEHYRIGSGPFMQQWKYNGASPTIRSYFYRITSEERGNILRYLKKTPLFLEITVNEREYYLVHGRPLFQTRDEYTASVEDALLKREQKPEDSMSYEEKFLWERIHADDCFFDSKTVIFGHTYTAFYQDGLPMRIYWGNNNLIGIDCGCSRLDRGGRLGCLCLENHREFYC